jgi:hypothetical protein
MSRRSETVEIVDKRFGYFPRRFCWRGRVFEVVRVEDVQCEVRRWPRSAQSRRYTLLTREGRFELEHDLRRNVWSVRNGPGAAESAEARSAERTPRRAYGSRLVVVR